MEGQRMTGAALSAPVWNEEQLRVISAPLDARMIVSAPAGTGKTAVLIARLAHLVDVGCAKPGSELLVLTFSRAAVGEIRRRLSTAAGDVTYVRAQTFDSFATHLLMQFSTDSSWVSRDFDQRIQLATVLLKSDETHAANESVRHVFIDELQDLVGPRVSLVRALFGATTAGFTLFLDRAQSIYDFQLDKGHDGDGKKDRENLIASLRSLGASDVSFSTNYRARTARARSVLQFGPELARADPDYNRIDYELHNVLLGLPTIRIDEAIARCNAIPKGSAILCRNNGQALVLSDALHSAGMPHELRRPATDRVVDSWLGATLSNYPYTQIGKMRFTELFEREAAGTGVTSETAWSLLKRIDRRRSDDVDLLLIAERLRSGDVPDELTPAPVARLVVSTVHRAKGLEFDRVFVCGFDNQDPDSDGFADELRLLYVALTRATTEILHMPPPDTKFMSSAGNPESRWVKRVSWNGPAGAVEVVGCDTHSDDPVGGFILEGVDVVETQTYLRGLRRGEPVELSLVRSSFDGQPRAFYRVDHHGRAIAVTSEGFGRALYSLTRGGHGTGFPKSIGGLSVDAVETVAGTQAAALRARLGPSALYLRARLVGLGSFGNPT
jgi:hypothetical protein